MCKKDKTQVKQTYDVFSYIKAKLINQQTDKISQQPENWEKTQTISGARVAQLGSWIT
jgi:hypothetical protein